MSPRLTNADYAAVHSRLLSASAREKAQFHAVRSGADPPEVRVRLRLDALSPRSSQPTASPRNPTMSPRPTTPLVSRLQAKHSRPHRLTEGYVSSLEREVEKPTKAGGSCVTNPGASKSVTSPRAAPPKAAPPQPRPTASTPAAAEQLWLTALAPAETAIARTEAAVAVARAGGKPSREQVEAASAQLKEARRACAALRGDVAASLGTLKEQLEGDMRAAFAAQGWGPPGRKID